MKTYLFFSLVTNLSLLFFFKYFNFFYSEISYIFTQIGINLPGNTLGITLPLGISFYTFQSMSYSLDIYFGNAKPTKSLSQFTTFVTLFPQLVAGPIVRYTDIANELESRNINIVSINLGIRRFIKGFAKKILIANQAALIADYYFKPGFDPNFYEAWLGAIAYTVQIYFDFSGYSDMAIGLGKILGFNFPENFNYPYVSKSIKEFWRRWHISLSTWFRDYLYIPLGGSAHGTMKTYRNLLIVFIICGFWHGASYNFLLWGLFHGFFLILERTRFERVLKSIPLFLQHFYTMFFAILGWVLFRAETLTQTGHFFQSMLSLSNALSFSLRLPANYEFEVYITMLGIILSVPFKNYLKSLPCLSFFTKVREPIYLFVFLISIAELMSTRYNPFIYFRF